MMTAWLSRVVFGATIILFAAPASADVAAPPQGATFAIQYQGKIASETLAAKVVDLDLFDVSDATIAEVKRRGGYLVCYLSAGSWEKWRPDADDFPEQIVGKAYEGWPGERWLDVSRLDLLGPILAARIQLAADRGCDAIDPDNLDGYQTRTGFPLNRRDAVGLIRFLSREAHMKGLAVGLKNVPELVPSVQKFVDFAVTEQCKEDRFCDAYEPLLDSDHAVFNIHYGYKPAKFSQMCADFDPRSTNILKKQSLSAWAENCPAQSSQGR